MNTAKKDQNKVTPALLLELDHTQVPQVRISGALISYPAGERRVQRMPLIDKRSLTIFNTLPAAVQHLLVPCTQEAILTKELQLKERYLQDPLPGISLERFILKGVQAHLYHTLQQLRPLSSLLSWFCQIAEGPLPTDRTIRATTMNSNTPLLSFELKRAEAGILRLLAFATVNGTPVPLAEFERFDFVLRRQGEIFLLPPKDVPAIQKFTRGYMEAMLGQETPFLKNIVAPLAAAYPVDRKVLLKKEIIEETPQCNIWLSELNKSFLMLRLQWQYGDFLLEEGNEPVVYRADNEVEYEIRRQVATEKEITSFVRALHSKFASQRNGYFYLPFTDAEKSQWFVKCYRKLTDRNIAVYGMDQLQHFRYNTHIPVMDIRVKKEDAEALELQVKITYGDQEITLQDIQKAILHHQPHLLLKDGTIGIIPEEWQLKYSLLMKLGQVQKNNLQLSPLHWTLTQELLNNSDESGKTDYQHKLERLQAPENNPFPVPSSIQAQLRDYQKAGFQWMCLLDEMKWGGCLADDMGLGKTLQTITFLQYIVNKYPRETHLVICPTSLIYNWEIELNKFAPQLPYTIYHGANRVYDENNWRKPQVIITSYGTARSDLSVFSGHLFGYVILDESQVIKNPASLTTKAVQALLSRNRIILSGTPIQNNTLDLYAQMNFVNPGLLGTASFFKAEFAQPIDKQGDGSKATQLRKLIYPFMLRRTKEQIAKDLPDKTEIVMWCEMGTAQREVYNRVKAEYRDKLLQRINENGMGSNAIYILEGLTRLRQICNAPQLVEKEAGSGAGSVKLDELIREIEENTGAHKVLVFSQFTGMLGLISREMENRNIPFLYLDGSTPAATRQELVGRFQEDTEMRVFLISLKAGGVGLTLTAADYVYMVDPWWNPAAEQQAIDRTHRIGQQNKVFAYKMICKDSVEEKILLLQERKKMIAADIISEETGFMKKLTVDDVAFLFS
jgi:SNF2 family DNA or RNA helicase